MSLRRDTENGRATPTLAASQMDGAWRAARIRCYDAGEQAVGAKASSRARNRSLFRLDQEFRGYPKPHILVNPWDVNR